MDDYKAIGARIRQARLAKKLTQVELAVAIGVSRAHLTNAEGGHGGLALDKLSMLASETGTTVAWLIGEADATTPLEREMIAGLRVLDEHGLELVARLVRSLTREALAATDPPPPRPDPSGPHLPHGTRQ